MNDRRELLARIRAALAELGEDGVDWVGPRPLRPQLPDTARPADSPAAAAATATPTPVEPAAAPKPPARKRGGWQPLVPELRADPNPSAERAAAASRLVEIRQDLGDCTRCPLAEKRRHIVFGEGAPDAPVVFVGEGPGADEDRSGRPFVGRAGELLSKMIEAVGWQREDVYICNIVKCRPPGNRDPQPEEVAACRGFLERQLRAIGPRAIVTLGKPAASTLLGRNVAITRERGQWRDWDGVPLMPTFHPAYVLRNYTRDTRQAVWDDLQAVRARVDAAD